MSYKKNEPIKVNYIALKKTTGLTDVEMKVYNPSDELVTTVSLVEIIAETGENPISLYQGSFTPTTDGQWRIRIESATNGDDISKIFEIGNYKLDDIKDQTQSIEDKVDIIDGNVDLIKTETDKIQNIDDNIDSVKSTVETIDGKVDTVSGNIDAIKNKTDNLPDNTIAEFTDIKDKLDDLDLQIDKGGYIL